MSVDDFDSLAARADLARLLAACFYEPGPEFVEERIFDSMSDAATRIDPSLAEQVGRLGPAFAAEDAQELLVDYTRIFLGPIDAPARPYGSVWLEARQGLMQDSTMALLDLYADGGFEMDESFRDLPDHVAAELEFLYQMLFRRAEAIRKGDADEGETYSRLHRRLLEEHLGRWAEPFTQAIEEGAQSAFYRELARTTRSFMHLEVRAGNKG